MQTNLTSVTLAEPDSQEPKIVLKEEPPLETSPSVEEPLFCEVCVLSSDGKSSTVFKTREQLLAHGVERHPLTCLSCFDTFDNSVDMSEHVEACDHKVSVCGDCEGMFPDDVTMQGHECEHLEAQSSDTCVGITVKNEIVKTEVLSDDSASEYEMDDDEEENSEDDGCVSNEAQLACLHCCREGFRKRSDLVNHMGIDHRGCVCCICFERFDDEESLFHHQQSMAHSWWKCTPCKRVFTRETLYRRHMFVLHQEQCLLKCQFCEFRAFSQSSIEHHHRDYHKERKDVKNKLVNQSWHVPRQMCCICKLRFVTGYSLLVHMYKHHNEPGQTHIFKCEVCNLGFGKTNLFELHLKEHHSDDEEYLKEARSYLESMFALKNKCQVCSSSFTRRTKLASHEIRMHPSLRPHKCDMCKHRYPEEGDLLVHKHAEHNGPVPYSCPACALTFNLLSDVSDHLWSVHGANMMPACYCFVHKKRFKRSADLRQHLRGVHKLYTPHPKPQERQYPCDLCGKNIRLERKSTHMRIVHGDDSRLKCKECGATFKSRDALNNHTKKHTGEFQCKACGKSFENRQWLERHAVVHSGEKPFQCELCGLCVSQKSALQRHVKVVHKGGTVVDTGRRPCKRSTRGPARSRSNQLIDFSGDKKLQLSAMKSTRMSKKGGRPRQKKRKMSSEEATSTFEEYGSSEGDKQPSKRKRVSADGGE